MTADAPLDFPLPPTGPRRFDHRASVLDGLSYWSAVRAHPELPIGVVRVAGIMVEVYTSALAALDAIP